MRPSVPYCLCLVAAACAHAGSAPLPVGADVVRRANVDSIPAGSILWAASRRLSWSDFLGAPQMGSDSSAVTSYVLLYSAECDGDRFTNRVEVAFVPRQSWVKPAVVMLGPLSRRALQHEQTHFDLAEIDARRIRRVLASLTTPCEMSEEERNGIVARFIQEDADVQERYDRETAHGLDRERQAEWEATVSRQLAALARHAQRDE